jgi:hypothetical protein
VYRTIVFYRSDPPTFSPAVSVWWPGSVIDLFNLIPPLAWANGNMPEGRCVEFIGACFSVPEIDTSRMEVWNMRLRYDRLDEWEQVHGSRVFGEPFLKWLFDEVGAWERPPVLVNMEPPFEAYLGGKELCRWVANPHNPERPIWVAPGSDVADAAG